MVIAFGIEEAKQQSEMQLMDMRKGGLLFRFAPHEWIGQAT